MDKKIKLILIFMTFALNAQAVERSQQITNAIETDNIKQFNSATTLTNFALNSQDGEGMTALMLAASSGSEEVVKELLKKKVDLEKRNDLGDTALAIAVTFEQPEIAELLINAGANVDILVTGEEKDTLLMAASSNNAKIAKLIVGKNKGTINKTNSLGETALTHSIVAGYTDITKMLLESGADKKVRTKDGRSALDIAKKYHNDEAIKLLSGK